MYYNFLVKLPDAKGKYVYDKRHGTTYVKYEYDRIYDPKKQITYPQRATIGKLSKDDPTMLQPNQNFPLYFPNIVLPFTGLRTSRSSCMRIGAFMAVEKILKDCKLDEMLKQCFWEEDLE